MRGEKFKNRCGTAFCKGSPPLARGKASSRSLMISRPGITPRLRGEKLFAVPIDAAASDHPPLTRGKVTMTVPCRATIRITPACAGKSVTAKVNSEIGEDHPRLRGEKFAGMDLVSRAVGSPPLARGKANWNGKEDGGIRITPACAGKSQAIRQKLCRHWDHPRLRGERLPFSSAGRILVGSPPLARGKD